ncbi:hypothetical protein CKO15_13285 [Halorhodospira abdelmalekii]|nr:hypothetical protein [Halorhodospira abdelmalekii]
MSNTREEWSAEARFSNCRVDFDGSSGVVNGTASGQRVVDISHNGDEDETGNLRIDLQGNFAGQPIVVDVTASWTHLWRDQARTWDETNRIPRAEIVLFSDYVGILDATIHWKEQGHSHGTYTEEENMTLTLGSSVLNGFVNITTPSTIVTHDDGYSDLCPTRGVLQIAGSGTAQIRYGEDMSVPRTNGVDLVVGGQTRTFTHCDDFEDEFYLGL